MSSQEDEVREHIINELTKKIEGKLKGKEGLFCSNFAKKFFASISDEDLQARDIDDIYGMTVSLWQFFHKRKPNEVKISIYNPNFEQDSWNSTHTIVQVVHDDIPFIVDSLRMELDRMELTTHITMQVGNLHVKRDDSGNFVELFNTKKAATAAGVSGTETVVLFEIERITDVKLITQLAENLHKVMDDVCAAVRDWQKMRDRLKQAEKDLEAVKYLFDPDEYSEAQDFLEMIEGGGFTLLGMREYELTHEGDDHILTEIDGSGLGVLHRGDKSRVSRNLSLMPAEARDLALSNKLPIIVAKTKTISTVHRRVYTDYVAIKQFNAEGQVTGELRAIGTFDRRAYYDPPTEIPMLRRKVKQVMKLAHMTANSHSGKILLNILEGLPRDDLFQASMTDLLNISMGIYHLQERKMIRMFVRKDVYGRYFSILVYVPRDRFDTELRMKMQDELKKAFHGEDVTFSTRLTEATLARVHFVIRVDPEKQFEYDLKQIEQRLIEISRSWEDDLEELIAETYGEEQANQIARLFRHAFPSGYREYYTPRTGVYDIKHIIRITSPEQLELNFSRPVDELNGILRLKIYRRDATIPLSDVIPILENLGLRIISERPYELKLTDGTSIWINDFGMIFPNQMPIQMEVIQPLFEEAFSRVWFGEAENDGFNKLVLLAEFNWREVMVARAIAKYLRQIGFTFSQDYLEATLNSNPYIAKGLIELFTLKFTTDAVVDRESKMQELEKRLLEGMDSVENLDEDRILRQYLTVIQAVIRTNYFQKDAHGNAKNLLSLKINPEAIPNMPLPKPMFEIFVYSPRFEAVHLRNGKVARGGLRWSDRREDFRTEILGLMKAQRVKNAVIVPTGAKGGFVLKHPPTDGNRESLLKEGITCYQMFIRSLLDITDNLKQGKVVKPTDVLCYDEDDTYLVVAADKGTATFSDIANEISNEYEFWLGDAFASGGSMGYDHKKMGITARGAWECVKRHFRERGIDTQTQPFTVVGIGDMSGDVFGNGLLLSKQIRLVAAFNHLSIFFDPTPNPEKSFEERERLFQLPRSNWTDYNPELISKGGGVFDRKAKSIKLTPEMKAVLQVEEDVMIPNDLIRAILRAPVDLLWNGGIGTYVKATTETHHDVGDRSNDHTRVDATELRCKVVGEGGNLGLTQLARVEYALNGGRVNTDFIDNSGGVDCSDHEVNIKILLNEVVRNGDLTEKQRNELLGQMTDEVAELVLADNYKQSQAISVAESLSTKHYHLHLRYMEDLERAGKINRAIEFLPDEKMLKDRVLQGKGLLRPCIATLLAYSKSILKDDILNSDIPEDNYLKNIIENEFPEPLRKRYRSQMDNHPLRREIIATQLANQLVDEVGFTFAYRLHDETGAPMSAIVRAYSIIRKILHLEKIWKGVQELDNVIPSDDQARMITQAIRLARRATRWFLRYQRAHLNVAETIERYASACHRVAESVTSWLSEAEVKKCQDYAKQYLDAGVPHDLAMTIATIDYLFPVLDIVETAFELDKEVDEVGRVYFSLGERLHIGWIRNRVIEYSVENHWEVLSREALRDDLDWQQQVLTKAILKNWKNIHDPKQKMVAWAEHHKQLIQRWERVIDELRSSPTVNFTMFFVATRELFDLSQTAEKTAEIHLTQ